MIFLSYSSYLSRVLSHVGVVDLPLSHGVLERKHGRWLSDHAPLPHGVVERLRRTLGIVELILATLVAGVLLGLLTGFDCLIGGRV